MTFTLPNRRALIAAWVLAIAVPLEGLWIIAALAVGGNRNGWLDYVIWAWILMFIALLLFWKFPLAMIVTALINLAVCVWTFYSDGQNFHDPRGLLHKHSVDLVILCAAFLGLKGKNSELTPA